MTRSAWIALALGLAGCPYLGEGGYTDKVRDVDGDGLMAERFGGRDCDDGNASIGDCDLDRDGFRSTEVGGNDCDDTDASISPDGTEACNGFDDDCDGLIDNDDDVIAGPDVYRDADGDGWGGTEVRIWCGTAPAGYVVRTQAGDCNDNDDEVFPAADERCDDVDHNCDGDPTAGAEDGSFWYADTDRDGHGFGPALAQACEAPPGDVAPTDDDCAPYDAAISPSATDVPYDGIDQDCADGDLVDVDGDLEAAVQAGGSDCDDNDPLVNANAVEICDGIDNDCDGAIDEGLILAWHLDNDGDSAGDPLSAPVFACEDAAPAGRVADASDCDDTLGAVNPSAAEDCDGIDNNCDGIIDGADAIGAVTRYADRDGDNFGNPDSEVIACIDNLPGGVTWVDNALDCNDASIAAGPNGVETCDGIDNDCNGLIDDNADDAVIYYVDSDSDGFGDPSMPQLACIAGEGLSRLRSDCDDSDPTAYPGAPEVCGDAVRQDCSTTPADDCDADGTVDASDCAPTDPTIHPLAQEICDGIDNDCDGLLDDADDSNDDTTVTDWYADNDGDGFAFGVLVAGDTCSPPPGTTRKLGDCDDNNDARYPGADERCDTLDNDCDGNIDEGAIDAIAWYDDADADGFGDADATAPAFVQCTDPGFGYAAGNTDCDDGFDVVNPLAPDVCDGLDNDCDGLVDSDDPDALLVTWFLDEDGDGHGDAGEPLAACDQPFGYVPDAGDCDDGTPDRSPGALELCDGIDNDCDGLVDGDDPDQTSPSVWFFDADLDGIGDSAVFLEGCLQPNGYVAVGGDCNDNNPLVSPKGLEACDGVDNDCDGDIDEDDAVDAALWFADDDGDAWGDISDYVRSCDPQAGRVSLSGDCDDDDPTVRPGAAEVCDGGIDNDCNGLADDADPTLTSTIWYPDLDGDGAGDAAPGAVTFVGCEPPPPTSFAIVDVSHFDLVVPGWSTTNDDCDDTTAAIGPNADEVCDGEDNDCDGLVDSEDNEVLGTVHYFDQDGDGVGGANSDLRCEAGDGYSALTGDCDDTDPSRSPDVTELCNGIDDDCDGLIDDGAGDVLWVRDADGDGAFDLSGSLAACSTPGPRWQLATGAEVDDCDDSDPSVYDGAPEVCDGQRNDCSGAPADAGAGITWFVDADADGFGDPAGPTVSACAQPAGYAANDLDCQDRPVDDFPGIDPANVHPGILVELCNGVDDDCDGDLDDDDTQLVGATEYFVDSDSDGFGDESQPRVASCSPPGRFEPLSDLAGDCDDTSSAVSPSASETCSTPYDDDCDGLVNDDDGSVSDGVTYYYDGDADGHGRAQIPLHACSQPASFVPLSDDCDDTDAQVSPSRTEEDCDGVDTDCSGTVPVNERDNDGDGWLGCTSYIERGEGFLGAGDCGPNDPSRFPGAAEQCNQLDDDCNELIDDSIAYNQPFWPDADGDSFGDPAGTPVVDCAVRPGFSANSLDCNDGDPDVRPGATEIAGDNVDQNCNGRENCFTDADDDGAPVNVVEIDGTNADADCDDPFEGTAAELAAQQDCNDADGTASVSSSWYADCDGDSNPRATAVQGCGTAGANLVSPCTGGVPPVSWSTVPGNDCNDNDAAAQLFADWYPDCDNDTYASDTSVAACGPTGADLLFDCLDGANPDGGWTLTPGGDCNDEAAATRPGAIESIGDGIDRDCDNRELCYADLDEDGARSAAALPTPTPLGDLICDGFQEATVGQPIDCNDNDPTGVTTELWFVDCDLDGVVKDASINTCGEVLASQLLGCLNPAATYTTTPGTPRDCVDTDASIFPGATEIAGDNTDQDCDRRELCFVDADNDGAYDELAPPQLTSLNDVTCVGPFEGALGDPIDCNDGVASIRPGASEVVGDEIDQDCDTREECWTDADDDGSRSDTNTVLTNLGRLTCDAGGEANTLAPIDCDDGDASGQLVQPWFADCDEDSTFDPNPRPACGASGAEQAFACGTLPPFRFTNMAPTGDEIDCVDTDPTIHPGASEVAGDNVDQDCSNTELCFYDVDGDFYKAAGATFETPDGDTDCNDTGEALAGAPDDCNDNDPSAQVIQTWFVDCDGDGAFFGSGTGACGENQAQVFLFCPLQSATYTTTAPGPGEDDCDDSDINRSPFLAEVVGDNIDQDCNNLEACYVDADNDGTPSTLILDEASNGDADCDDAFEGLLAELYAFGSDCDDNDPTGQQPSLWYPDRDNDTFFDGQFVPACGIDDANTQIALTLPAGQWRNSAPDPETEEDCNDFDQTASQAATYYPDCDGDAVSSANEVFACGISGANLTLPCLDALPPDGGWLAESGFDCDDEDASGSVFTFWYPDCDADGAFANLSTPACTLADANSGISCPYGPLPAEQWTTTAPTTTLEDCDDINDFVGPGFPEVCDGFDNACGVPRPLTDNDGDGDGYVACSGYVEHGLGFAGGDDCLDDGLNLLSSLYFPGQTIDMALWPYTYSSEIQPVVDQLCGDGTVQLAPGGFYYNVTLPPTKVVVIEGNGAEISSEGGNLVTFDGSPAGTELRNVFLNPLFTTAVAAQAGADVVLRGVSVQGDLYGQGALAAGLYVDNATLRCENCSFDSTYDADGSAVRANGADVTLVDTDIFYASGDNGPPVLATNSTLTMNRVVMFGSAINNAGYWATAVGANNSVVDIDDLRVENGSSPDRQPSVMINGGSATIQHLELEFNPGGLWLVGSANAVVTGFRSAFTDGRTSTGNHEGAIELRDSAQLDLSNAEIFATNGPGIHLRQSSAVDMAYSTVVGNAVAGVLVDTGNTNLTMHHSVTWDNPVDIDIDATYTPPPINSDNHFGDATGPSDFCFTAATCGSGSADFVTWFTTLPPYAWVLRPRELGVLWNGALPVTDPSFDATPIIGHSGGPGGDALEWYIDSDGDGMPDGWELRWFFDLTTADGSSNNDTDALLDFEEYTAGTDPFNNSTDFDFDDDDVDIAPLDCAIPTYYGCYGG